MEGDLSMLSFFGTLPDEEPAAPVPLPVQPLAQAFPKENLGKIVQDAEKAVQGDTAGVSISADTNCSAEVGAPSKSKNIVAVEDGVGGKRKRGEEGSERTTPKQIRAPKTSEVLGLRSAIPGKAPVASSQAVGNTPFETFWESSNAAVPCKGLCAPPESRDLIKAGRIVERKLKDAAAKVLAASDFIHQLREELHSSAEESVVSQRSAADNAKKLSEAELALRMEGEQKGKLLESVKKLTEENEGLKLGKAKVEEALKDAEKGLSAERGAKEALEAEVEALRLEKGLLAKEVDKLKSDVEKGKDMGRKAAQHYYKIGLRQVECLYPDLDPQLKSFMSINHVVKDGKIMKLVDNKFEVVYERPEKS